jgi:hypothetical protein
MRNTCFQTDIFLLNLGLKDFMKKPQCKISQSRSKALYLGIRRRRWRNKNDKSIEIKRDYSFIANGSKLTVELSDFLKQLNRAEDYLNYPENIG